MIKRDSFNVQLYFSSFWGLGSIDKKLLSRLEQILAVKGVGKYFSSFDFVWYTIHLVILSVKNRGGGGGRAGGGEEGGGGGGFA